MIKKSDKKYAKVCGCDEYGREAWLMVSQHKDSDNIEVLSSEEGSPVVYTKSRKGRVGCCRIYPCRGKRQTDPYKKFVENFTFCKNQAY